MLLTNLISSFVIYINTIYFKQYFLNNFYLILTINYIW